MKKEETNSISEKNNLYLEYVLFLILGFLLGVAIKTEAAKRITVGYNDYQIENKLQAYNMNQLQKEIIEKAKKEKEMQDQQQNQQDSNKTNEGATTEQ